MLRKPVIVAAAHRGAGDDPELVRAEAQDREIRFDAAGGIEPVGVRDASRRTVDIGGGNALKAAAGARAPNLEDRKAREVDDADAFPKRLVLGRGVVVPVLAAEAVLVFRG